MAHERLIAVYDWAMSGGSQRRYYGDSGFFNFGHWGAGARSQREASEALVDRLLEGVPQLGDGRVLDVACGVGGSTARLMRSYPAEAITAINISSTQLAAARARAPECGFEVMDATGLRFPDGTFNAVMCVEAAFHFETREAFLREALRVLAPGGALVFSDIIFRRWPVMAGLVGVPLANRIASSAAYQSLLERIGFVEVELEDATGVCLGEFRRHLVRWPNAELRAGRMRLSRFFGAMAASSAIAVYFGAATETYLLGRARKPN